MNKEHGRLIGVGVGPGDPELITLKAIRIIENAEIIAYPKAENKNSMAKEIVQKYINENAEEIIMEIPMKPQTHHAQKIYDKYAKKIKQILKQGKNVVAICEGDPFFYGSFMYLYQRISKKYICEVVPGVASVMASACVSGTPLVEKNQILSIVPATQNETIIRKYLKENNCVVFVKIGRHLEKVRKIIEQEKRIQNATYIERVGLKEQKIMKLENTKQNEKHAGVHKEYFSIIIVEHASVEHTSVSANNE